MDSSGNGTQKEQKEFVVSNERGLTFQLTMQCIHSPVLFLLCVLPAIVEAGPNNKYPEYLEA
eukprot:gene19240-6516_t